MIKSRNLDPATAGRYVILEWAGPIPGLSPATYATAIGAYMFAEEVKTQSFSATLPGFAKIVDVVIAQANAGAGGTSVTFNVKKNGTTIFGTNGVFLLAAAANTAIDAKAEIATVTNTTRPVLTTTVSNLLLKKGDVVSVDIVVAGTYTGTAPQFSVHVVVDPYPV
jgi:hypothetical protein